MPDVVIRKNNIVLADYPYQRDIQNRIFMAELSIFDVDVLKELIDGSLKTDLKTLCKLLKATEKDLKKSLEKFAKIKLIKIVGDQIHVDKELRKYYESQVQKFDNEFEPDMEFLQGLLSKVPIHALPNWYSIPPMTNNIFASIVENYLLTPKIYERYLAQLKFPIPALNGIMRDLFGSAELKLDAKTLIKKYKLTREQFEEYMLILEFSFVCCLGYNRTDTEWKEVVTPFHEWRTYLMHVQEVLPKAVASKDKISRLHLHDFGFLKDLSILVEAATETKIKLNKKKLSDGTTRQLFPHNDKLDEDYYERLLDVGFGLNLLKVDSNILEVTSKAHQWPLRTLPDQAHVLSRLKLEQLEDKIRDFREIKHNLKNVQDQGWILFEDFVNSMTSPIGKNPSVTLLSKGKRWSYVLPSYGEQEMNFIRRIIFEILFDTGVVALGTFKNQVCFCVTNFGKSILSE